MDYNPLLPHGFSILWGLGIVLYVVFVIIAVAVAITVIVLLVRFLLIGTRAAQLYVSLNSPAAPVDAAPTGPGAPHAPAPPAPSPTPAAAPAPSPAAAHAPAPIAEHEPVAEPAPAPTPTPTTVIAAAASEADDDLVFSEEVIPPVVPAAEPTDVQPVPVKKPATRAPRKPRTPPAV